MIESLNMPSDQIHMLFKILSMICSVITSMKATSPNVLKSAARLFLINVLLDFQPPKYYVFLIGP